MSGRQAAVERVHSPYAGRARLLAESLQKNRVEEGRCEPGGGWTSRRLRCRTAPSRKARLATVLTVARGGGLEAGGRSRRLNPLERSQSAPPNVGPAMGQPAGCVESLALDLIGTSGDAARADGWEMRRTRRPSCVARPRRGGSPAGPLRAVA